MGSPASSLEKLAKFWGNGLKNPGEQRMTSGLSRCCRRKTILLNNTDSLAHRAGGLAGGKQNWRLAQAAWAAVESLG